MNNGRNNVVRPSGAHRLTSSNPGNNVTVTNELGYDLPAIIDDASCEHPEHLRAQTRVQDVNSKKNYFRFLDCFVRYSQDMQLSDLLHLRALC